MGKPQLFREALFLCLLKLEEAEIQYLDVLINERENRVPSQIVGMLVCK
jgi:hypothetical protein